MSPPHRPPIPLQMAGGRPQPGNLLRRPTTPTPGDAPFPPVYPADASGENARRNFDFTFESAVTLGSAVPPTTPAASSGDGPVAEPEAHARIATHRRSTAAETTTSTTTTAIASTVAARLLPVFPIPGAGGLYGRPFLVGQRQLHFETSPRMDNWLEKLQALSLERHDEEAVLAAGEGGAFNNEDNARIGDKRSAPVDDDDQISDADGPATKRSRVGAAFQRTFSRASRRRAGSTNAAPTSSPTPSAERPGVLPACNIAASNSPLNSPVARSFSPFGFLSHIGSGATATAGTASTLAATRTIKICLVGDVDAGKTALFNRITNNSFLPTSTSIVPEFGSVFVRAQDGSVVNVELWDFPGVVTGDRPGPLLSTFFHAAIICFSLENKENVNSLSEVWKPKLNACLHDQHVFVLGLKRDLRPSFPALALSFLPPAEPVTIEMGRQAAEAIHASGYGECSSRTGENVQGAWEGVVDYIIASLEEHEQTIRGERRRGRAREAVAGFLHKLGRLRRVRR